MSEFLWIDSTVPIRILLTLCHFVWQGCLLGGVAWCLVALLRNLSSMARYLVFVSVMITMLACLPTTYLLLGESSKQLTQRTNRLDPSFDSPSRTTLADDPESRLTGPSRGESLRPDESARLGEAIRSSKVHETSAKSTLQTSTDANANRTDATILGLVDVGRRSWLRSVVQMLAGPTVIVYLIAVSLMIARLGLSMKNGKRLRRESIPLVDEKIFSLAKHAAKNMRLSIVPVVAASKFVTVPVVVGVIRPIILLPASMISGLSPEQVRMILLHEFAHVRHHDLLICTIQRIVESLLFFHPAVWYVSKRISIEREHVADDTVVRFGHSNLEYAEALLSLAEIAKRESSDMTKKEVVMLAATGGSPSELRHRICRLLGEHSSVRIGLTFPAIVALIVGCFMTVSTPYVVHAWTAKPKESESADRIGNSSRAITATDDANQAARSLPVSTSSDPDASVQDSAQDEQDAPMDQSPIEVSFVIAKHVNLYEGEIVTWDEIIEIMKEKSEDGKIYPRFFTTGGGFARNQELDQKRWEFYAEFYEDGRLDGMSMGGLSGRASNRYDKIESADDLLADESRRIDGQIVNTNGEPIEGGEVFLLPASDVGGIYLRDGWIRNRLQEHCTTTDEDGLFTIHQEEGELYIVATHPTGFSMKSIERFQADQKLTLYEWAQATGRRPDTGPFSQAGVTFQSRPFSEVDLTFYNYETEIADDGTYLQTYLPPGNLVICRSLENEDGSSTSVPIHQTTVGPGIRVEVDIE